jgi:hypothetical protein
MHETGQKNGTGDECGGRGGGSRRRRGRKNAFFCFFLFSYPIDFIFFVLFALQQFDPQSTRAFFFSFFFGAAEEVEAFACMTLDMRVVQQIPDPQEPKWDGCVWFSKSSLKVPSF